jgi:hypothetical protein
MDIFRRKKPAGPPVPLDSLTENDIYFVKTPEELSYMAIAKIDNTMIGIHFSPHQAEYLKKLIDFHTWPQEDKNARTN